MKNKIIVTCIVFGLAGFLSAATRQAKKPFTPNPTEFAHMLVSAFGGEDRVLDELEMIKVLDFLRAHLPENTGPSGLTTRINRENNARNAPIGDMTEERHALREYPAEAYVGRFIDKYDRNGDKALTYVELTDAMANVMGMPRAKKDWKKKVIANR